MGGQFIRSSIRLHVSSLRLLYSYHSSSLVSFYYLSAMYAPTASGSRFYSLIKLLCGTLFLLFGYDAGVLGGLLTYPPFLKSMGNPTGAWTIPMISSAYTLAACVTSPFVATFAFHIGRRGCMMVGCVAVIIGAVVQASSYGVAQIIVGRLITGRSYASGP